MPAGFSRRAFLWLPLRGVTDHRRDVVTMSASAVPDVSKGFNGIVPQSGDSWGFATGGFADPSCSTFAAVKGLDRAGASGPGKLPPEGQAARFIARRLVFQHTVKVAAPGAFQRRGAIIPCLSRRCGKGCRRFQASEKAPGPVRDVGLCWFTFNPGAFSNVGFARAHVERGLASVRLSIQTYRRGVSPRRLFGSPGVPPKVVLNPARSGRAFHLTTRNAPPHSAVGRIALFQFHVQRTSGKLVAVSLFLIGAARTLALLSHGFRG